MTQDLGHRLLGACHRVSFIQNRTILPTKLLEARYLTTPSNKVQVEKAQLERASAVSHFKKLPS